MALSPSHYVPYEAKTVYIKVYSYTDKNIVGALSNTSLDNEIGFSNLTELILIIERILGDLNYPQATVNMRSFNHDRLDDSFQFRDDSNSTSRTIARFSLKVMYKQYSSWQGTLVYIDENQEINFRSVLELIYLLDSVLSLC